MDIILQYSASLARSLMKGSVRFKIATRALGPSNAKNIQNKPHLQAHLLLIKHSQAELEFHLPLLREKIWENYFPDVKTKCRTPR